MKNELARELACADEKVQYDTQCKKILGQKMILAWILKYTAKEFEEFSIEEICGFIEKRPEVSTVYVNPGETNVQRITGEANEDKTEGEGAVSYDIRFYAILPQNNEKIRMIIDVEAQKSFYPGYEIVTRGIFYVARMISAQLGTEFSEPHYDEIKKVYSIWICMNAPAYIGNSITEHCFTRREIEKGLPDKQRAYDKMSVFMISLNKHSEAENPLLKMLNVLLSVDKSFGEKVRELEDFGIPMRRKMKKELKLMCNLSEYVFEQGMEQGIEQGIEKNQRDILRTMLAEGYQEKTVLKILGVTPEKLTELRNSL